MYFLFENSNLAHDSMKRMAEHYAAQQTGREIGAAEAAAKAVTRSQLEIWALANRRARAALAFPSQLTNCRTPASIASAYFDFWQSAFTESAETTRRIGEIFTPAVESSNSKEAVVKAVKSSGIAKPRLTSSFNGARHEPKDAYQHAS